MVQPTPIASTRRGGFTLIELGIVVLIIGVLMALVIPAVSKVRTASRVSATANLISQLSRAIDTYHTDFRAYPGPLANDEIANGTAGWPHVGGGFTAGAGSIESTSTIVAGFDVTSQTAVQMTTHTTMAENLVLGLLGGLKVTGTAVPYVLTYDPSAVGAGPISLNTAGAIKRSAAYIDATNLSWRTEAAKKTGHYKDEAGEADDTLIPEFVDQFVDAMPILYLRAKVGVTPVPESDTPPPPTGLTNSVVTYDSSDTTDRMGMYDLHQIIGYVASYTSAWPTLSVASPSAGRSIGVGKPTIFDYVAGSLLVKGSGFVQYHGLQTSTPGSSMTKASMTKYNYPYDAYPYFKNQSLSSQAVPVPQQKDGYILISAGADRVFGTDDDITNFGEVGK